MGGGGQTGPGAQDRTQQALVDSAQALGLGQGSSGKHRVQGQAGQDRGQPAQRGVKVGLAGKGGGDLGVRHGVLRFCHAWHGQGQARNGWGISSRAPVARAYSQV